MIKTIHLSRIIIYKDFFWLKYLPLYLILIFHVAAWFVLKPVWPFADDYCYAFDAFKFNTEELKLSYDQFQNRFGVYLPAAFLFKMFGITPYTISLWPLIASCFTIALIYIFLDKLINSPVAILSSCLIATNVLQVTYSIALFPDLIVSMYAIAAILILYRRTTANNIRCAILFPVVISLGLITKETIMMIFPFVIVILILDLIKKDHLYFWRITALSSIATATVFFLTYWIITGDPLHLVKTMIDFNNNRLMDQENADILKSMFNTNIFSWLNNNLGLIFLLIFSVPSFVSIQKLQNNFKSFITLYSVVLLVLMLVLFHTEKYGAVFLQPRIWMLLIAPLSILSALIIYEDSRRSLLILFVLFLVFSIINLPSVSLARSLLYFSFPLIIGSLLLFKHPKAHLLILVPFIILSINFVVGNSNFHFASARSGNNLKYELEFLNRSGKKTILSAEDFALNHIIYNGFREYENLTFFPFSKIDSLAGKQDLYVIVNNEETSIPEFISGDSASWSTILNHNKIQIFRKK